jgi:hypothetical protein
MPVIFLYIHIYLFIHTWTLDIFRLLYCTLHRGWISSPFIHMYQTWGPSTWALASGCPPLFNLILLRSVHALVLDAYAQRPHQFLTRMLSARISSLRTCCGYIQDEHLKHGKTDALAEHACKELMRMVRVRISSWPICASMSNHAPKEFNIFNKF